MPNSTTAFAALADTTVDFALPATAGLNDDALLDAQRTLAEIRRRVDAAASAIAAEIAHRSRPELGYDGLAQRLGARTPALLVQQVTGSSSRDARALVRVGTMMSPSAADADPTPWLADVAAAVATGQLSLDAAEAIRAGLGAPSGNVTADALAAAASTLLAAARQITVEALAARAREARNELDQAGVRDREQQLRDRRYLHVIAQADGMTRLSGLLDPESAAIVVGAYDTVTSPRRGGPRFVDPTEVERAEQLLRDERTTEQVAVDAFVELIRIATLADSTKILGSRRPAVHVHVTASDLAARSGVGHLEGQTEAVSIETVERHICDAGAMPIVFDGLGQVIDEGREERLFTWRQRIGIAARDGGCLFPGCDRPPSWCEAHHIVEWQHGGRTDIADGVLLCRHHHLLVHNNGWRVERTGATYSLVPPASLDPSRRPIPAPSKSPMRRRALALSG